MTPPCSRCGQANALDARFCQNCGSGLGAGPTVCARCQQPLDGGARFCPTCGNAAHDAWHLSGTAMPPIGERYASFWPRVCAALIDGFVVGVPVAVLSGFVGVIFTAAGAPPEVGIFVALAVWLSVFWLADWLYTALMLSSPDRATHGKAVMGLIVTDMHGRRISFGRATGRHFARIFITGMTCWIGYLMVLFTERRQALHDLIAECVVLERDAVDPDERR